VRIKWTPPATRRRPRSRARACRACKGEDSSAFYVVLSGSLKDLGTAVIKSDGEVLGFDDYSLTRPRHAAVVALDRVVAVIFNQRTLDAIGRRDAHVLSTIVRAAASSGHDQL
jgi:hypothetical protein